MIEKTWPKSRLKRKIMDSEIVREHAATLSFLAFFSPPILLRDNITERN